jgi:hypothetical protein
VLNSEFKEETKGIKVIKERIRVGNRRYWERKIETDDRERKDEELNHWSWDWVISEIRIRTWKRSKLIRKIVEWNK